MTEPSILVVAGGVMIFLFCVAIGFIIRGGRDGATITSEQIIAEKEAEIAHQKEIIDLLTAENSRLKQRTQSSFWN